MNPTLKTLRCLLWLLCIQIALVNTGLAQTPDCSGLTASYSVTESRCTATGTLQINATGGSGQYNYKLQGTSTSDFTSSSLITGLAPGTYSVMVKDIVSNCTFEIDNIIITGTYSDPRFGITETDVTCMNGNDGTISVSGLSNGRGPFVYTIVSPSPSSVGASNSSGNFTGLIPGSYFVQLSDSCGGIQTRNISIQNYNWSIASLAVTPVSCTNYNVAIGLIDSKGHTNASGTTFNGYTYGYVNGPGDTTWMTTSGFALDLGQNRSMVFVVKDNCGLVQTKSWTNTLIPSVQANPVITGNTCSGFNVAISGQQNLTSPTFCLTDPSGNPVSGQPCNTTGTFTNIPYGSYCIQITNTCYDTVIKRCFVQAQAKPAITGSVALSNYTCTSFQAAVTGQQNLTNPQYCLMDQSGNPISGVACNTNGIFPNLPYGPYQIQMTDGCTDTIIKLNFTGVEKIPSVAATVTTKNFTCTGFDASITGQSNLNSPQYCLVDSVGNPITCNTTGIFTNLNYGSYCINITDACADTTIQRCITIIHPAPSGGSGVISNKTCSGFTVTISGQLNMFNGLYCLQDSLGNPVSGVPCNSSGVFTNIPYGSYCVKTTDGCSGATLTNCFNVTAPVLAVGPVVISNQNCTGFTATVTGQQNLTSPNYCLFDSLGNAVGACNSTGIFAITVFGTYSIQTTDACAGQVFTSNFSLYQPIPSVGSVVNFTNQTCTTFDATITGQSNLTNPLYNLKDSLGNILMSNNTGVFSNILYGSYCIDVVNGCADTTITRCFNVQPNMTLMNLTAHPSCAFNASDLAVQVSTGFAPYTASVYNAADSLLATQNSNSPTFTISGLPALAVGESYKVIVNGTCGSPATQFVTPQPSSLSHVYTITPKCPSSITLNGSGDLLVAASTNLGTLNMSIIAKNGVADTIGYAFRAGNNFTFSNLDAATYVVTYTFTGCSTVINDTVTIPNYMFPVLAPSGAYQCDNNSFSVGAVVSGGIAPYNYQIIGSEPSIPSINSPTQSNPIFTINNGVQYSLVRLRAIDACGNATLNDVSILPLANTIVTASSDCIYQATTLSTDIVANATYSWYKKDSISSTDSVLVGTGPTYSIPAISISDTGIYVNRMSVNSGCLTRLSYFHLDGLCNGLFLLPQSIKLSGQVLTPGSNELYWVAPIGNTADQYEVQRFDPATNNYVPVGLVSANKDPNTQTYQYVDKTTAAGPYYYRLRIIRYATGSSFSNVVVLSESVGNQISVYPNPVADRYFVHFNNTQTQTCSIRLINVEGQQLSASQQTIQANAVLSFNRDARMKTGIYFLQVIDSKTGNLKTFKLNFE